MTGPWELRSLAGSYVFTRNVMEGDKVVAIEALASDEQNVVRALNTTELSMRRKSLRCVTRKTGKAMLPIMNREGRAQ